jgi:hypothetical protein
MPKITMVHDISLWLDTPVGSNGRRSNSQQMLDVTDETVDYKSTSKVS